ncbi:metallophosphoesterase [Oxalobacteraceae bacterium OM1]|nr:metallophosphoesterase [Oxalobacteraceae bacterium OM1]
MRGTRPPRGGRGQAHHPPEDGRAAYARAAEEPAQRRSHRNVLRRAHAHRQPPARHRRGGRRRTGALRRAAGIPCRPPGAMGDDAGRRMNASTTVLHFSDLHFGTEIVAARDAALLAARRIQPDVIVVSGDITQRARQREYLAAKTFLDLLPGRAKLVIPGNHDIPLLNLPARVLRPYAGYVRTLGAPEGVWNDRMTAVVALNTTTPFRHTRGRVPVPAFRAMAEQARKRIGPDGVLIAVIHQPFVTAQPEDADEVLMNAPEAARLFAELGVDAALSGHVHYPLLRTTLADFPELPRPFVLCGAGTTFSHRVRQGAPNSFHAMRVVRGEGAVARIEVTAHVYDTGGRRFAAGETQVFVRDAGGWQADR